MPVSRNQPSPQRQSVLSFVSPKVADLLFFETVDAQRVGKTPPAYGTAHPDTKNFPKHKLCHVKQADANGLFYEYYYAADRDSQDDYNFEFSQADLGGNEYDTVVRTYVIKREDFDDDAASHEAGDAMPNATLRTDDTTFFSGSYILMGRQQRRIEDETLDGLFVVEQRIYIRYEDKVTFNTDLEFNDELKTTEILAYVGKTNVPTKAGDITWAADSSATRANWGIKAFDLSLTDNDGVYNYEVERLSTDWWKITEQQIVGSNLYNGYVFKTRQNYSYPAELIGFRFTTIDRRDGSAENSVTSLEKDAFSGPILMTVTRRWYETASTANGIVEGFEIDTFKPRSGTYSGALFSLSYSNVLTKPFTLIDTVGTGHPTYKPGAYANNFFEQGSTPTKQPAAGDIVNVSASSRQFRGGFLVETVTGVVP
mgnify:FL=1